MGNTLEVQVYESFDDVPGWRCETPSGYDLLLCGRAWEESNKWNAQLGVASTNSDDPVTYFKANGRTINASEALIDEPLVFSDMFAPQNMIPTVAIDNPGAGFFSRDDMVYADKVAYYFSDDTVTCSADNCVNIAVLGQQTMWDPFRRILMTPDTEYEETPAPSRALYTILRMGANPDAKFIVKHGILSSEASKKAAEFAEHSLSNDDFPEFPFGHKNVYKKPLDAAMLINLIGQESTSSILDFFHESHGEDKSPTEMYIARHSPSSEVEKYYTPWHKDCYYIVEVQLGDFETESSWLTHLDKNGAQNFMSNPGTAIAHGTDVVHGTAPFYGDKPKYLLVLKHHPKEIKNKHPKDVILSKEIINGQL